MREIYYLLVAAIAILSLLVLEGGSAYKHANGWEQCNNQTGNNCPRSNRLPLPLPFDDGSVESTENGQGNEENGDEDVDNSSENEIPLPLPFP